jgi:hypothetical protein
LTEYCKGKVRRFAAQVKPAGPWSAGFAGVRPLRGRHWLKPSAEAISKGVIRYWLLGKLVAIQPITSNE